MEAEAVREYFYELTDQEGMPDLDVAVGRSFDDITFIHNTVGNEVGREVKISFTPALEANDKGKAMLLFAGLLRRFMEIENMRIKKKFSFQIHLEPMGD